MAFPVHRELHQLKRRSRHGDTDLVFARTATNRSFPQPRARAIRAWAVAGVEPITLHDAGHCAISFFIASRLDLKLASTLAGHSHVRVTEEDDAERRRLGQRLYDATYGEWNARGVVLDQRYRGSPPVIVDDGSHAPAWDVSAYASIAKPGHRAPHAWLEEGLVLYDRLGPGLTLVDLGAVESEVAELSAAAHAEGVPLTVLAVEDPQVRELYGAALVLVRPDQHIAWRGDTVDGSPEQLIANVSGAAPATVGRFS
jgi:hypothetical protein